MFTSFALADGDMGAAIADPDRRRRRVPKIAVVVMASMATLLTLGGYKE